MPKRYLLFGTNLSLEDTGKIILTKLCAKLEEHESSYKGGAYLRGASPIASEVIVQYNYLDDEGYLTEGQFPECSALIYVTQSFDELQVDFSDLFDIKLLRVEEI